MPDFLSYSFFTEQFVPHGHCYLWQPGLVGLHVASDLLTALSYYSISVILVYFVYKRRDVPFQGIFLLFGAFIIACGTTHLIEVWTLWHPVYWLSGAIKAITAIVSLYTVSRLIPLIPKALALPSSTQLEAVNRELENQISDRVSAEAALQKERNFLNVLLDHLEAGIVACDDRGVLTLFNQATRKFHDLPEQPLPAEQWAQHYNLYLPNTETPMKKEDVPLYRALQGECLSNVEMTIAPKQGAVLTVLASGQALFDPQGKKLGAVVTMHDITERKRMEQALIDEQKRLSAIIATQYEIASAELELHKVMHLITDCAQTLTHASGAVIELAEGDEMVYRAASGTVASAVGLRLKIASSLSGSCTLTGDILRCDDTELDPRVDLAACRRIGVRSMIVVPLQYDGKVVGVLKVLAPLPHAFADRDVHTLQLMAGLLAAALSHVSEFEAKQALVIERTEALEALQESEERFRQLSEAAFEAIAISDMKKILDVNSSFAAMFGCEPAEAHGMHPMSFVAPESHSLVVQKMVSGDENPYEVVCLRKDGTTFLAEVRSKARPYRDHVVRMTAIRDMTERKRAEVALQKAYDQLENRVQERTVELAQANRDLRIEIVERVRVEKALRESERRFRATFEQAAVGIAHVALTGRWLRVNQRLCDIVGYSREELLKLTFQDITHPDDLNSDLEYVRQMLAGEIQSYSLEKRYIRPCGSQVWTNLTVSLKRQRSGEPNYFISVVEDISDRKQAEKALRDALQRLNFHVENSPLAVIEWDRDLRVSRWSQQAEMIFGWQAEEVFGKKPSDWQFIFAEDLEAVNGVLSRLTDGSEQRNLLRNRNYTKNGSVICCDWYDSALLDESGNLVSLLSLVLDVTERIQAEEQLKASLEEKVVLLKEIHHRVKNNLQIISSLLNLQSDYLEDDRSRDIFKVSQNRIESMALIHEKLYQSKDLARINFAEYVQDLVDSLLSSYELNSGNVSAKIDVDDSLLSLDAAIPCGLIINELVLNSLKHAFPTGTKGEISVTLTKSENNFTLSVGDNGIGFPAEVDFQNTKSLGLQLVNALINQLKGTIELNRNDGVEFKIIFAV